MSSVVIGAAALLVVALLAFVGIAMRRTRPARIDSPEEVATVVEAALPGFSVAGAVVGADGAGALAVSDDNRVAAIVPVGRRVVAREVGWHAVRATADGIVVETGDRRLGRIALAGVDVLDIRRLAPATAGPSAAALAARGIAIGAAIDDVAGVDQIVVTAGRGA